jgi:hypothetical protein
MTADAQFTIHRDNMDNMIKAYDELLKILTVLERTDPEMKEKYMGAIHWYFPVTVHEDGYFIFQKNTKSKSGQLKLNIKTLVVKNSTCKVIPLGEYS